MHQTVWTSVLWPQDQIRCGFRISLTCQQPKDSVTSAPFRICVLGGLSAGQPVAASTRNWHWRHSIRPSLKTARPGMIVHSDRGSQYASLAFRGRLDQCGLLQSMSRKGNCYDNAPMESFFKSFKVEEVYHNQYQPTNRRSARQRTTLKDSTTRVRLHSSLGYVSPNEFEHQKLYEKKGSLEICLRRSHSSVARQNLATDNGDREEADFKPAFVGEFRESERRLVLPTVNTDSLSTFLGESSISVAAITRQGGRVN